MKAFIAIQVLATMLAAATAADSVRGARQLDNDATVEVAAQAAVTKKITYYRNIKLSPENMIPQSDGVPKATGIATVKMDYNLNRTPQRKVCVDITVVGFTPRSLHIQRGSIKSTGSDVVDFSPKLDEDNPIFSGCITPKLADWNAIKANPVRRHRP